MACNPQAISGVLGKGGSRVVRVGSHRVKNRSDEEQCGPTDRAGASSSSCVAQLHSMVALRSNRSHAAPPGRRPQYISRPRLCVGRRARAASARFRSNGLRERCSRRFAARSRSDWVKPSPLARQNAYSHTCQKPRVYLRCSAMHWCPGVAGVLGHAPRSEAKPGAGGICRAAPEGESS